ncbi:MAG TPA: Asp-tRNA(Asn)/Glu-tRNA(Gln) amidotransferase subunit GatA [Polyangiales bacterium]|nr:Asp-tRNA(Asn)/Glu-tRNA(Gln) amidotransferase subunit GatA [Polyangiales bacterium]
MESEVSTLATATLTEIAQAVRTGSASAVEVTRAALARIESKNASINAYLHVAAESALADAERVDRARAQGAELPLAGVPIGVKDNLCTRGIPTTCASKILAGYVPPYDAHVVQQLRAAGAVMLGKLNLDEFAMGSSNETSAFGPVKNPWDLTRAPGGTSGGSAAAVALGLGAACLGSDTGGSVRQPASFCGVTAIKPSYGRVSRYGLIAFASSLDQVGPIARNMRDAATLLGAIAGHDARDATSAVRPVPDYVAECGREVRGLRLGVVRGMLDEGCAPSVKLAITRALEQFAALGCEIVEVDMPNLRHAISVYYIVAPAEASSNLARFDGMRYGLRVDGEDLRDTFGKTRDAGFGAEVKRRIMLGTYVLSAGYYDAFYLKAQKVRTLIQRDYAHAFERCDALLTPTAPTPAFKLGEKLDDPLAMYLADIFTLPASLAGIPAVSVPCGLSDERLPIGLQLAAPAFEEARLVRLGAAYEQVSGWDYRPPGF